MTLRGQGATSSEEGGLLEESVFDAAVRLQSNLVAYATGGGFEGGHEEYQVLRGLLVQRADTRDWLPAWVRRCRDLDQFWQWIKNEKPSYAERRELLYAEFAPLLDYLEERVAPGAQAITDTLATFDADGVQAAWQKALDRRVRDPEGAITAARTLLESVCKHVIEGAEEEYPPNAELPQLWRQAALLLNLAPEQHQEEVFKAILGNAQSIVSNLGSVRNKLGDAHALGPRQVRPRARHAELVVNLAGSMAAFIVATWVEHAEASN